MKTKPTDGISNVKDLVQNLETNLLRKEIDELKSKLESKDQEIAHLKSLLESAFPAIDGGIQKISDEETIAELQLQKLKAKAQFGELTLEEVKKFDLLVKNKRLAQGTPTTIPGEFKKLPSDKTALIQLASSRDDSSEGN